MHYHYFSKYIASIYRKTKSNINHQLDSMNLRATQSDLLMFIHENPNLQQSAIAKQMSVDPSLLAKDLTVLASQNLVVRETSTTDRRAKTISLTPSGERMAEQLTDIMDKEWHDLFAAMPHFDAERFADDLHATYQALLGPDKRHNRNQ
ncbi:MarR family transcriptional regulator [Bifidobacterium sp. ESL0732]|uniref:MarR family winged helix-turn-helix transcriptional regulator n=1 Tax=Bifidobacterium sp. ESL0732 TaxID=2983222 RepID=UPI0023F9AA6F|nr:MarR family transcriptional regulator [Bifidobacterium sp. ESL0732]WEV63667.1 MarR family transcriptional regulator [Bifidobacterium sp. ESL0732]